MFDREDLEKLEKICWQQLDVWNHQGMYAEESEYVWFMHKDKRVVDPWQKEDYQVFQCIWPNHSDVNMTSGEPYTYYGSRKLEPFFEKLCRKHGLSNASQRAMKNATEEPEDIDYQKWFYESDIIGFDMYRYALGEKGKRPLIVFGINPSTATPEHLDATLKAIKGVVDSSDKYNGYMMFNIYPQRATNPMCMHYSPIDKAYRKNLEVIEEYLSELTQKFGTLDIWAAWGENITTRKYLKDSLRDIAEIACRYPVNWMQKGNNKNPHHPLYLKRTMKFIPFDLNKYLWD